MELDLGVDGTWWGTKLLSWVHRKCLGYEELAFQAGEILPNISIKLGDLHGTWVVHDNFEYLGKLRGNMRGEEIP